jgi:tetratricopeptide (TPR) repeat protein
VLPLISATDDADASITYVARAIAATHLGDLPTARANLNSIQELHATMVKEKKLQFSIDAVDEDGKVVSAWIEHAEGQDQDAINTLRKIADKEQGTFAAGGGIPAHEMIGDILVDTGRPAEALAEYEAELKLSSNRFNSLYGAAHAAELSNQHSKAADYYEQLTKVCESGNSTRPELAHARSFVSQVAKQN